MTTRDDAIEAVLRLGGFSPADAADILDAVEPIIRADERVLLGRVWAKREDLLLADVIAGKRTVNGARAALGYPTYAEVADELLVEVICEDDLGRGLLEAKLDRISLMWRAACKERDAARAEVVRLNIEISKVVDSRERNRVEMGQKVIDANREAALARAALAGLRAKVAAEHDASFFGTPDGYETGRRQAYRRVLALIEEADRADS